MLISDDHSNAINPPVVAPVTDVGTDTLARFRYQAEVTLPFCLRCALGDDFSAVIPEYLEDIAIESKDGWRFIQVKSRNPERGLWKLADLLSPGGALRTLLRTHHQIRDIEASLEIVLEGAVNSRDPIKHLLTGGDRNDPDLLRAICTGLQIENSDAQTFLSRITLQSPPAPRPHIASTNILLIQQQNTALPHAAAVQVYQALISEIERAMRAEPIGPEWPRYVISPASAPPPFAERLALKRLTRSRLGPLVATLLSPVRYLLRARTDRDAHAIISPLTQKLTMGGAESALIQRSRILLAAVHAKWFTDRGMGIIPDDALLEDLYQRIETHAAATEAIHAGTARPANQMFYDLLNQFTANSRAIDVNGVMNCDPQLLVGLVCYLADECRVNWGVAREQ